MSVARLKKAQFPGSIQLAEAISGSFHSLHHLLDGFCVASSGEIQKAFGVLTVCNIGFKQVLDGLRCVVSLDVAVKFAPDRAIRTKATTNVDVVAVDGVAVVIDRHASADQTNVANVVLSA